MIYRGFNERGLQLTVIRSVLRVSSTTEASGIRIEQTPAFAVDTAFRALALRILLRYASIVYARRLVQQAEAEEERSRGWKRILRSGWKST